MFYLKKIALRIIWAHMPRIDIQRADSKGPYQTAHPQSDQGLGCQLIESLTTTECINGEQIPGSDFPHSLDEFESVHFAHVRGRLYAWRGPYQVSSTE